MTNIWTDTYKEIRKPFFEIEDPYTLSEEKKEKKEKEEKGEKEENEKDENGKPKRWWDDDGDGVGYEKGEVKGSFKGKKKGVKEERELHSKKDKIEKIDVRDGIKNKIEINPSIEEQVKLWIDELVTEGYDISKFTFDEMVEIYESADAEQLDEISQKLATKAYATSKTGEFEGADSDRDLKRTDNLERHIKRKFGDKAVRHAERAATAQTFGRKYMEKEEFELDEALTGERYKKVMKKPGGTAYSRKVSADPEKRATRGGRGGESDFGSGDRGSGNRAARRAGTYQEEYVDEADTSAMPARGDAVTTKVDPTESARRRAAQAQVRKERADVQLSMARATAKQGPHESVVSYLMNNNYIAEGVYDPKKSKLRPASERTAKQVTDKDRAEAKKKEKRTAEIHSKGETVLAGLRSSGKKGKVSTKPAEKPEAPESNRKLPSNRRNDTLAKKADEVLKKLKK